MDDLTIKLPPSLLARVLSLVPADQAAAYCLSAIEQALDRRTNLTKEAEIAQPKRMGRPPKGESGERRVYRSVGLSGSTWGWIDELAKSSGLSINDAMEQVFLDAKARGFAGT